MSEDQFKRAENEFFRLKGQFAAGRLTRIQFETALRDLMVQDAQGRYWMLGVDSGNWFWHDGKDWVAANPYGDAPPSTPPPRLASSAPPPPPTEVATSVGAANIASGLPRRAG